MIFSTVRDGDTAAHLCKSCLWVGAGALGPAAADGHLCMYLGGTGAVTV